MKRFIYATILLTGALATSCNDFLDEMPDNRTEINTTDKITKILVSAYSTTLPIEVHEQMSDNVTDRGVSYTWQLSECEDAYYFNEKFQSTSSDSPNAIWEDNYKAAASANMALEAIENSEDKESLTAQKGEALLCRAYAHFVLCNVFCQAYNPQSSETDLGIPYIRRAETTAINSYERGTVAEVYRNIAADIEEGLPLIDDNLYTTPKYHFNKAAANAFAAQFYLFYGKYERAIECATAAIGEDPSGKTRDFSNYAVLTKAAEFTSEWVASSSPANLLLQGVVSTAGRMYYYSRAVLTDALTKETIRSLGPWGNVYLIYGAYVFSNTSGNTPSYLFPKQTEYFVYSDEVQQIGTPYVMNAAYTVEKTLLNRAEAYALLGEYDKAAADLSDFYIASEDPDTPISPVDAETIAAFYESADDIYKKPIAPRFTVNAGMQENLIHACLHARRILTIHEGTRMLDIKRYGIAYTHVVERGTNISIAPYDARLALQIPDLVLRAGMQANPR